MTTAALFLAQAIAFAVWLFRKPRRLHRLLEVIRYSTSEYALRRKMRLSQRRVWVLLRTR